MPCLRKNCSGLFSVICSMRVLRLPQGKRQRFAEVLQGQNSCVRFHGHTVGRQLHGMGEAPPAQVDCQDHPPCKRGAHLTLLFSER